MEQKSRDIWVEREIYPSVLSWLEEPEIIAIAGPRQSGKTTLLSELQRRLGEDKTVYVNFEESLQIESFIRSPKDFIRLKSEEGRKRFFLFDEFQYVENGGKILKILYDEFCRDGRVKFIITGSSSLKIREIASFLVGRVIFFNLYPFSFAEFLSLKDRTIANLWKSFNSFFWGFLKNQEVQPPKFIFVEEVEKLFEEYLIFGGYPKVVTSPLGKKQERLHSLIETYIEKDIIKYLRIGNFLAFKNFTRIIASQIGNLVNYSSIGSEARLSFAEIKNFLGVLEQTFVVKLLRPFFSNKITEIKKSPKVYFQDSGLRNALISDFREMILRQDRGALVENFVFQNLSIRHETEDLRFWRTKQGAEVDFILNSSSKEFIPLEVKYQKLTRPKIDRSSLSFFKTFKPAKAVVLTRNLCAKRKIGETEILFLPVYFL